MGLNATQTSNTQPINTHKALYANPPLLSLLRYIVHTFGTLPEYSVHAYSAHEQLTLLQPSSLTYLHKVHTLADCRGDVLRASWSMTPLSNMQNHETETAQTETAKARSA